MQCHNLIVLLCAGAGLLSLASPAAAVPVNAQVTRCDIVLEKDPGTDAVGNTAARRRVVVQFGYADSGSGTIASQVADTNRVEVCSVVGTGALRTIECPWSENSDDQWVIYDAGASKGVAPDFLNVEDFDQTFGLESIATIPIDWADPANDGTFLLVRVNGTDAMSVSELATTAGIGGFCPVPYLLAGGWNKRFRVHGIPRTVPNPFTGAGGGFDPCLDGNRAGPGVANEDACIDQLVADYTFGRYKQMDDWLIDSQLGGIPLNPKIWEYGSGGDCGPSGCPFQVFLIAMPGYSLSSLGANRLAISGAAMSSFSDFFGWVAAWVLGNLGHEYIHAFQSAWRRAAASGANQSNYEPFEESGANALQSNHCLFSYPDRPTNLCVNLTRLVPVLPDGTMNEILDNPSFALLGIPYRGSIFWRYAIEQYASPLNASNAAHPAGTTSSIPSDDTKPLGHIDRRADEGTDLMRHVLDIFEQDKNRPILDAMDLSLQQHLGRALEPLVHDLHTAMVLKDYKDVEPRWRFEWVGNANAGGGGFFPFNPPTPSLETLKPFPVPPDLKTAGPDFLNRAARVLDSYDPGAAAPVLKTMAASDFLASASPKGLSAFGSAFLSVHPVAGFNLRVRLLPELGTSPRFRIFTVDGSGVPTLLPNCDKNPSNDPFETGSCQLAALAVDDGQGGFTERYLVDEIVPIPANGDVEEVIVVASAGRQPASFSWTFGDVQPTAIIIDPTTSTPAQVGHVQRAGAPVNLKRPFLLQFALLDENGLPMSADTTQLQISAPGCAAASCILDPASDYKLTGFAGGVHWAVVTLPGSFYPSGSDGFLDLRVEILNLPTAVTTAANALHYHDAPYSVAMYMVLDKSGSMADFGGSKLQAMQIAGKAVFESLADTDAAGVITFNEDAQLRFGILPLTVGGARDALLGTLDQVIPEGCTSIGDGVLEAQQFLALTFDTLNNPIFPTLPDRQVLLVMSDGLGNSDWPLYQYYTHQPFPNPFLTDGEPNDLGCFPDDPADNGAWFTATLRYPDRKNAGLPLPLVSAVALGTDADIAELQNLVDVGGGLFTYLPGPADATPTQAMSATIDLSDAFRQIHDDAAGFDRVQVATPLAALPELMPDLPVDTNVSELLVTVTSSRDQTDTLRLVDPSGTVVTPTFGRFQATTFRIPDPIPGTWTWQLVPSDTGAPPPTPNGNNPAVFVEQAVRSTLVLFAGADVVAPFPHTGQGGQFESGRYVGSDVFLRAIPIEGAPITGASVSAEVTAPDGSALNLILEDDGLHNDGDANDGIYGALYSNTSQPGAYPVRVFASGTSPATGGAFTRERHLGFALHAGPDTDGDGLPDPWERRHGTNPGSADAGNDPDGDGLDNETEFMVGTRPLSADSDGGGESDASELSGGRDPLDASDDRAFVYMADVVPGNGKVLLRPRVDPDAIELVEVQRAPDPLGPYGLVFSGALPADGIISDEASNDGPACYRMRTVAAEIISGWSPPVCVQPAADPFPPVLAPRAASFVDLLSATAVIELEASAFGSSEHDRTDGLLDPAVRPTPLESVRFSARRDFEDAEWVPFQSSLTVPLAPEETTVLYFQVRDGAGNVSQPRLLAISRNAGEEEPSVPLGLPSAVLLGLVLSVTGSLLARTRRRR